MREARRGRRGGWLVAVVVLAGGALFIFGIPGRRGPAADVVGLEGIERVVVYDVQPSLKNGAYTRSVDELETYTKAEFDTAVFCRYVSASQYVTGKRWHFGGNLLVVFYEDGSERRMMIAYYAELIDVRKGYCVTEDEGASRAFRAEHRRIVENVFIPQREKRGSNR